MYLESHIVLGIIFNSLTFETVILGKESPHHSIYQTSHPDTFALDGCFEGA
jgi:hypothetical protein